MPGYDGSLIFDTKIDQTGFDKGIASLEQHTNRLGDTIKGVFTGNVLSDLFKGAATKLADFARSAIMAASDLAEVQNVVDVTFGASADAIQEFADGAMKAYGLTEMQAKQYTSTLGAMLKSLGIADKDVLSMSIDLTKLTGDMASFYNLDHDTAYQKIKAGLSGESEPLKALGINLSSATLNAYALQQGLSKTYDKMSEAEKVNLRYMYIMEATADAQGDFSRTSEGFSNQLRILQGNIANLTAGIGEKLLPAATGALQVLNSLFEAPAEDPMLAEIKNLVTELDNVKTKIEEVQKAFQDARISSVVDYQNAASDANTYYTSGNSAARKSALNDLLEVYPELAEYVDKEGKLTLTYQEATQKIEEYKNARIEQAKLEETVAAEEVVETAQEQFDQLTEKVEQIERENKDRVQQYSRRRQAETADLGGMPFETFLGQFATGEAWNDMEKVEQLAEYLRGIMDAYGGLSGLQDSGVEIPGSAVITDEGMIAEAVDSPEYKEALYDTAVALLNGIEEAGVSTAAEINAGATAASLARKNRDSAISNLESANEFFLRTKSEYEAGGAQYTPRRDYGASVQSSIDRARSILGGGTGSSSRKYVGAGEYAATVVEETEEVLSEELPAAVGNAFLSLDEYVAQQDSDAFAAKGAQDADAYINAFNARAAQFGLPQLTPNMGYGGPVPVIPGHATGLDRVPYDGYIARLHVGESVLNAADASAYRAGRAGGIDYDALAGAVAAALPKNTGKTVLAIDGVELAQVQQRRNYDSMSAYDRRVQLGVGKR